MKVLKKELLLNLKKELKWALGIANATDTHVIRMMVKVMVVTKINLNERRKTMIKSLNTNIDFELEFEERMTMELEDRVEMAMWACDCDGFQCSGTYTPK